MTINYELAKREGRGLRASLTRAINSDDPDRVIAACRKAVQRWDAWGAWPDDWARWQVALTDFTSWRRNREPMWLDDLREV